MTVSIVVPVYNEVATVDRLLRRLAALPLPKEVVVVDDGSTDGTGSVLRRLHKEGLVDRLLAHDRNQGKGAALRIGFACVTGDVVVVQDADLEYDPADIPSLLVPISSGNADAVYGSRFLGRPHRVLYFWHMVGNKFLTFLSNIVTDLNLTDIETCYKAVRADLLRTLPLSASRFGIEPEITARLAQAGARIWEVPVTYAGRTYAEGKKIGWKDGAAAIWHILRFNLLGPKAPPWTAGPAPWESKESAAGGEPAARGEPVGRDGSGPAAGHAAGPAARGASGPATRDAPG